MQADIQALFESLRPKIAKELEDATAKQVADAMSYSLRQAIAEHTSEYIKEHVLPDVTRQLVAQRAELVAAIVAGMHTIGDEIGKAITARAMKTLSEAHQVGKITEILMKGY